MIDWGVVLGVYFGMFCVDLFNLTIRQRNLEQTVERLETQIIRHRDQIRRLEPT